MSSTYTVQLFPNRFQPNDSPKSANLALSDDQIRGIVCMAAALFGEDTVKVLTISNNQGIPLNLGVILHQCGSVLLTDAKNLDRSTCPGKWTDEIAKHAQQNITIPKDNYTIRVKGLQTYVLSFSKWDFFRGLYLLSNWIKCPLLDICDNLHFGDRPMDLAACLTGQTRFLDENTSDDSKSDSESEEESEDQKDEEGNDESSDEDTDSSSLDIGTISGSDSDSDESSEESD